MSASKCARCELTVYPVEGLNCLDKIWHKGCFKCHECSMTLNMKNYKGYDKKPYCNAHCPQAKATTVADTPEIRRLAENTRIQSQAKYHEDFERSKGKGFTAIADDPETVRIKNTSKIISNVAYHGELERKKQMEEKRGLSGSDDHMNNNNNLSKQQNRMRDHSAGPRSHENDVPQNMANNFHNQQQQQPLQQNIMLHQQQQHLLKQQQQQQQQLQKLHHQQQQHQQQHIRAQDNNQSMMNRHSQHLDIQQHSIAQQQPIAKQQVLPQQYPPIQHPNQQHHQQMIMRQQQQQMMMQRHSMDSSLAMNRQLSKQSLNNHNPNQQQHQQQQLIRHQLMQNQSQSQLNQYLPINDSPRHQPANPMAVAGLPAQQMMNPSHLSGQRVVGGPNPSGALLAGPQGVPHHLPHGYNNHPPIGPMMNGGPLPKQPQQQQHYVYNPSNRQMPIHPSQMQQINHHQQQQQQQAQIRPQQQMPIHQMPRRVFRAMYDYVANDVDEVSFFENDILIDCVNVDGNWLIGKVARSGQTGMLPANYVAEISG